MIVIFVLVVVVDCKIKNLICIPVPRRVDSRTETKQNGRDKRIAGAAGAFPNISQNEKYNKVDKDDHDQGITH